jgi:F-type H+-transporting ATPase subunit a
MAPLELVSQLAKPISLMFRMFGNIVAGFIIMGLIWSIPPMIMEMSTSMGIITTPFMIIIGAGLAFYFSIFGPFIQATVFSYLTLSNFGQFLNEEES